MGKNAAVKLRG